VLLQIWRDQLVGWAKGGEHFVRRM